MYELSAGMCKKKKKKAFKSIYWYLRQEYNSLLPQCLEGGARADDDVEGDGSNDARLS